VISALGHRWITFRGINAAEARTDYGGVVEENRTRKVKGTRWLLIGISEAVFILLGAHFFPFVD